MLQHVVFFSVWERDSRIDSTSLKCAMYSHPLIHSKYLSHLQAYKIQIRKYTLRYNKLRALKTRYFCGEMSKEELDSLSWKQYLNKKPLKSEMEALINGEPDVQELQEKILYIESLIQTTEMIMKDISNRYFLFKSLVEYEKFQAGI